MNIEKQNKKQILLGLILLSILAYLGFMIVSFFVDSLLKADPKISASIIAGMFTILAGLTAVIITQKQTKLREIEEAHRGKKIEIYTKFITTATSMLSAENDELDVEAPTDKELVQMLFNFKREILLWGSPKVIKAQLDFEKKAKIDSKLLLSAVDKIYKAMREDIGLSNSGLDNYELIKIFLTDPEEVDKIYASNKI